MRRILLLVFCLMSFGACDDSILSYSNNDLKIEIKTGKHWLHEFPLFLGIFKDNPPQFAVWMEDTSGNYLSTIYVTSKIATESWIANKGNRRKEALPHWCHQRGVEYEDGFMLPTKENPFTDGITGATPKTDKNIKLALNEIEYPFVVKAEINHSTDWNDYYPKNAKKDDENFSGGKSGSGQPALIYSGLIDENNESIELKIIGHSSVDGSDGLIYNDIEKITSAKSIIKLIKVNIMEQE